MTDMKSTVNQESTATEEVKASDLTPTFSFMDGNTTIIVGVHFKKKSKTTLDDKVRKLISADVRTGNF